MMIDDDDDDDNDHDDEDKKSILWNKKQFRSCDSGLRR